MAVEPEPAPAPGEPGVVVALRGLPGSGKSTWAKAMQAAHPAGVVVRVNNDEISTMLYGSVYGGGPSSSQLLRQARAAIIRAAATTPECRAVLVDNTNLGPDAVTELQAIAADMGWHLRLEDRFLAVPVQECLRRNAQRPDPVPDDVIRSMARQIHQEPDTAH